MLRKYDDNDLLAKMFLLFNALLHGITGGYLVVVDDVELQADTYIGSNQKILLLLRHFRNGCFRLRNGGIYYIM